MEVIIVLCGYLIFMNILGIVAFGSDKSRARRHAFRIPEATLFLIAIMGGSIGSLFGMYTFRHKTKHWYFVYGMPLILIIQISLIYMVINSSITFTIL